MRSLFKHLPFGVLFCLAYSASALADTGIFGIGPSVVMFTKVSKDGAVSGMVPFGVSAWMGYFLTDKISAVATLDVNLAEDKESGQFTTVFLGGSGVVSYHLTGGSPKEINLNSLVVESVPRFNTYLVFGASSISYNFNAFDESTGKIVKRAANNTLRGAAMGFVSGAGASVNIGEEIFLSFQGKIFKGLADEITPELTNLIFCSGVEVMF